MSIRTIMFKQFRSSTSANTGPGHFGALFRPGIETFERKERVHTVFMIWQLSFVYKETEGLGEGEGGRRGMGRSGGTSSDSSLNQIELYKLMQQSCFLLRIPDERVNTGTACHCALHIFSLLLFRSFAIFVVVACPHRFCFWLSFAFGYSIRFPHHWVSVVQFSGFCCWASTDKCRCWDR